MHIERQNNVAPIDNTIIIRLNEDWFLKPCWLYVCASFPNLFDERCYILGRFVVGILPKESNCTLIVISDKRYLQHT